ncbi:MAG: hypothetical protein HY775_03390 [Acidobacteria bacterium]|nr:hypothetical protein [Acidobacteriota bacterium]
MRRPRLFAPAAIAGAGGASAAIGLALGLLFAGPVAAQVPPVPTPPVTVPPVPGQSPTPSPTPTETPTPSPTPSPTPTKSETRPPETPPSVPPAPFTPSIPDFELPPRPSPAVPSAEPAPAPAVPRPTVAQSLPAAYGLGSVGLVGAAVALPAALGFTRPRRRRRFTVPEIPPPDQEDAMPKQPRRWRLAAGAALIASATVVAIVGYLKISVEPSIARQIPYLASAGLGALILAVTGGSLLMADQIRAEDDRVEEIERSVERLAELVAPTVERPARVEGGGR